MGKECVKVIKNVTVTRHCLAHLVEQASHVQRLCPRCGGPGFESRPGCPWPRVSLILFPVISSAVLLIKLIKGQHKYDSFIENQLMSFDQQKQKHCIYSFAHMCENKCNLLE